MNFLGKCFILLVVIVVFENCSITKKDIDNSSKLFVPEVFNYDLKERYKGFTNEKWTNRNFSVAYSQINNRWRVEEIDTAFRKVYFGSNDSIFFHIDFYNHNVQKAGFSTNGIDNLKGEVKYFYDNFIRRFNDTLLYNIDSINKFGENCLESNNQELYIIECVKLKPEKSILIPTSFNSKKIFQRDTFEMNMKFINFSSENRMEDYHILNEFPLVEQRIQERKGSEISKSVKPKRIILNIGDTIKSLSTDPFFDLPAMDFQDNKPKLLYFWFKSCFPCLKTKPFIEDIENKNDKNQIAVYLINTDSRRLKKDAQEYIERKYNNRTCHYWIDQEQMNSLGVYSNPYFMLLDENNIIKYQFSGFDLGKIEELESEIDKLIN